MVRKWCGFVKITFFIIFFHMGSTFCFFAAILMAPTYTPEFLKCPNSLISSRKQNGLYLRRRLNKFPATTNRQCFIAAAAAAAAAVCVYGARCWALRVCCFFFFGRSSRKFAWSGWGARRCSSSHSKPPGACTSPVSCLLAAQRYQSCSRPLVPALQASGWPRAVPPSKPEATLARQAPAHFEQPRIRAPPQGGPRAPRRQLMQHPRAPRWKHRHLLCLCLSLATWTSNHSRSPQRPLPQHPTTPPGLPAWDASMHGHGQPPTRMWRHRPPTSWKAPSRQTISCRQPPDWPASRPHRPSRSQRSPARQSAKRTGRPPAAWIAGREQGRTDGGALSIHKGRIMCARAGGPPWCSGEWNLQCALGHNPLKQHPMLALQHMFGFHPLHQAQKGVLSCLMARWEIVQDWTSWRSRACQALVRWATCNHLTQCLVAQHGGAHDRCPIPLVALLHC